ncbi:hypothetical protein RJ641_031602 [Dillenia turbinata]|uniref:PHD-type zinc finger plants domain-containing protein n=1 Tax=Dillenia turbinata TaxID=194707 RepID=A0AAN8VQD7_9MAGN
MVTTCKEANTPSSKPTQECCMCGDLGLSYELFKCKLCQFRSQHRYCSDLYPKAETYQVCNWCLNVQREESSSAEKAQNSSNSSEDSKISGRRIKINGSSEGSPRKGGQRGLHTINSPIKKQRSPERSSPGTEITGRKRIVNNNNGNGNNNNVNFADQRLRRTKSGEISNGGNGIKKQVVFRNKVRRYKLLDEVSS